MKKSELRKIIREEILNELKLKPALLDYLKKYNFSDYQKENTGYGRKVMVVNDVSKWDANDFKEFVSDMTNAQGKIPDKKLAKLLGRR